MLKIFDLVTIRLEQAKILIRLAMTELVLAVRHAATNVNIIACRCQHNCIQKEPLCIYPCQNNFDRSKCIQSGTALRINIKRYCISSHKYQSYYDTYTVRNFLLICFSFLKWCIVTVYQARSFEES